VKQKRIDQLNDVALVITAKTWRGICMGFRADGEPAGSNTSWSQWRKLVGIVKTNGKPTGQYMITRRDAFLLLVRSRLDRICGDLGIATPRVKAINIFNLEDIANQWIEQVGGDTWESAINNLAGSGNDIPGDQLAEVIREWLGKPISIRTIRRKCRKVGIRFSMKRSYTPAQMQRVLKVIQ
jgi:hypothetical protein